MRRELALILIPLVTVAVRAQEAAPADAPRGERPWVEIQNRISSLNTRTQQQRDQLNGLIQQKKKAKTAQERSELDAQINQLYKEYKGNHEELFKQEQIFKYRFPERAAKEPERTYESREVLPLEKIEEQIGIEGKLHRNLRKMRSQYGPRGKAAEAPEPEEAPAPEAPPESGEKSIIEQDSPILKK